MTIQGSNLQSEQLPDPTATAGGEAAKVAGQSPTKLAIGRFRKDRLSMVSLVVVVFYFLCAVAAPILVKSGVLDPFTLHNVGSDNLLDVNTLPAAKWGGISASQGFFARIPSHAAIESFDSMAPPGPG